MAKKQLSTSCPYCDLPMRTASMSCASCGVQIEGDFSQAPFNQLSWEDQHFLEEYLLSGFSIKSLEQNGPYGYAAIRSRLDRLIANYKDLKKREVNKKVVLEELRKGKITVDEAKEQLGNL